MAEPANSVHGNNAAMALRPIEQWHELFAGAADAACAVDAAQRILLSNDAFTRLCRRPPEEIHGRFCREVICGRTLDGQCCCGDACTVRGCLTQREPVENFDIAIAHAGVAPVWVNVGVLNAPRLWNPATHVFVLRPINLYAIVNRLRGAASRESAAASDAPRLTRRESEILRLLAGGHGTRAIAQQPYISALTVRNHIRNIYARLEIGTRAEAVCFAFRHGLL